MYDFAVWLGKTSFSLKLAQTEWIIPVLQSMHILAVAMVLSAVAMIELRLFGIANTYSMRQIIGRFMPLFWGGLAVLAITGAIQITAEPKRTLNGNTAFYLKMAMLASAIGVMIAFQAFVRRHAAVFDDEERRKLSLQLAAIATLALWIAIAVAGRWIAYAQVR